MNWEQLANQFGFNGVELNNAYDPESCIHELVHMYDCIGTKAFNQTGCNQRVIGNMVRSKYKTDYGRDRAEIRVSAITFLCMQQIGGCNLTQIISDMTGNLTKYSREKYTEDEFRLKFLAAVRKRENIRASKIILKFLEAF